MGNKVPVSERILYIDNHLIAVNKLPGELSQGDETGDRTLADDVKDYLKTTFGKPGNVYLGIIHRLDRPTSGAVIYARTQKGLERMNALLRDGNLHKTYWACIDALPPAPEGELENYLYRDPKKNKTFVVKPSRPGAKLARLSYRVLRSSDRYHLVEIDLHTGRHHQIRSQFAELGIHIKGDLKYGFPRSNPDGGIHLHSRSISFVHPVSHEPVEITAPVPDDSLWKFFEEALR